jgi:hypothetical protein
MVYSNLVNIVECVSSLLLEENIFTVLTALLQESRPVIRREAIVTISRCYRILPKSGVLHGPFVFTSMMQHLIESDYPSVFYAYQFTLDAINYTPYSEEVEFNVSKFYTMLNRDDKTPQLLISPDRVEVRNDSWTFESIRGNIPIPANSTGKYAYETILFSDGIIQVGFASLSCVFDAEVGSGVGDDGFSYAFDGNRCRKWHGVNPRDVCLYAHP